MHVILAEPVLSGSAAATILGDIGTNNPDVIKSLVKALKDEKEDVQYKAGIALEKLDNIAIDTFVKMYPLPPDLASREI